jgi:predicted double-glycine peptidase
MGHYRVVIGYDNDCLFVNDPEHNKGNERISVSKFCLLWEKTNNGEVSGGDHLVLVPKDRYTISQENGLKIEPIKKKVS